jgi:pimeloyl-ACP methyl ester carboxylesterase
VAPDWRGFGLSACRTYGYWFPDYVADLDVLLSRYRSDDDPVCLLGHSMGANAAGLYAGIFPERVRAFINVEGFGLADSDPDNAPANYRRWIEASRKLPGFQTYRSYDELAARILKRAPSMTADKARFVARHWATEEAGHIVLRADPAHKLPNAVQYRRAEASACWNRVEAPVLLVLGANTRFRAEMKSWLDPDESRHPFRGSHTEVVADAGHMVHFEQPGELARIAEAFLADLV